MRIIFIVDNDETPVASTDWPAVPRVGEIVQFGTGKYQFAELTVEKVTYMPMLTFIESDGKDVYDGLLVAVALSSPNKIEICNVCCGSGITGNFDNCTACDGLGKIVVDYK